MSTISETICSMKPGLAFVPFITAGYPNIETSKQVIQLLDKNGANLIEIGIPYSDALADGVVIQESSHIALGQSIYIDQVLDLLSQVSPMIVAPVIIFTYFNPVLSRGLHRFIREIAQLGVKGLVVPDLPLEESDYLIALCNYYDVELILFVSPASSKKRIKDIIYKAPGALYFVSSYGVTGSRKSISCNLRSLVADIKQQTDKCIMLGFGIYDAVQVREIVNLNLGIDAIIMGTAFTNQIKFAHSSGDYVKISEFCESIVKSIHKS